MRAIVQRVARAGVSAGSRSLGKIGRGFAVLLGVGRDDTEADADYILDRVIGLRVFADAAGKMNLPIGAVGGALLIVSQFTLHADTASAAPRLPARRRPTRRDGSMSTFFRAHACAMLAWSRANLARRCN